MVSSRPHREGIRYSLPLAIACALVLAACGSAPPAPSSADSQPVKAAPKTASNLPKLPRAGSGRGGYYQDDGPGDAPPEGLLDVPDAEPQVEPISPRANRPYVVFGKSYTPITDMRPYKKRGVGSWYGKKFHGQKTSSGELYDMYKMTAAHPTLPIPSYARVTNLSNGNQVIVRINDRGPFLSNRIIDLSYTAALKLGYLSHGSSLLEVERLLPDEIARINSSRKEQLARAGQIDAPLPAGSEVAPTMVAAQLQPAEQGSAAALDNEQARPTVVTPAQAAGSNALVPGFYLQLGSYSQAANAEAARDRLTQQWRSDLPPLEVAAYGVFFRLYSGPFGSRVEAAAAAAQLQEAGTVKPLVVQR
jgi:rare lipoprotein A